jgi:hypothetical protein
LLTKNYPVVGCVSHNIMLSWMLLRN